MSKNQQNKNIIIYVEGQTEKYFLQELGYLGKIEIFNLWENEIHKYIRLWKDNTLIYFIFDVDIILHAPNNQNKKICIQRFNNNLKLAQQQKGVKVAGLLQQNENFEDEIIRSCSKIKNKNDLFKSFNAVGHDEFKNEFNKKNKLKEFLLSLGLDISLMWKQDFIPEIQTHQSLQADHSYLTKN